MHDAVDKESGGCPNPAPGPAVYVLLDTLQVDVISHLDVINIKIEFRLLGILSQVCGLKVYLVLKQQIVHLPEFLLSTCGFCCLSRQFGMGVHFAQREMPEHEAHALFKMFEQNIHRMISRTARRAFEISVFDNRDLGGCRSKEVVVMIDWDGKGERLATLSHFGFLLLRGWSINFAYAISKRIRQLLPSVILREI